MMGQENQQVESSANHEMPQNQQEVLPKQEKKSFKFKLTIFMLCTISVVVAMDSVIVAATLPAIASALRGTSLEAFWVGTSYLLAQTVTVPIYGTVSNIFGRKWVIVFAMCIFLFGSIMCGCAQNMEWLIGARVVQGLGGGGCLSLTTVIISDITTLRDRPKYLAMGAFAWALGTNIGVPVGGAIGQFTSWRWVFWLNIPICVVSIIGIIYALHLHQEITSLRSKLARIDWLGMALFVAATTMLLYGITTGGTAATWQSVTVLSTIIIGSAGLCVFVVVEWKVSPKPMIPIRIFANRTANTGFFGAFIHGLVLWAFAYYMIIFFLGALQHHLFKASAETLPGSAPVAISGVFCGIWVARTLRFQKLTWAAWILLTAGTGLNALMKPNSNAGIIYVLRVIPAVGAGLLFQLPVYAVQSTITDDDLGIATASLTFFRSAGQAFGVAIGGTVFQNQFERVLKNAIVDGRISAEFAITGKQAASAYSDIASYPHSVQLAYQFVYADSLRTVWYVTTGIAALGLIVSLWMKNESLDRGNNAKQKFKVESTLEEAVTDKELVQ